MKRALWSFLLTSLALVFATPNLVQAQQKPFAVEKFQCTKDGAPYQIEHYVWQHSTKPVSLLFTYKDDRIMIHKCYLREDSGNRDCLSYYQGSAEELCKLEKNVRKALRLGYSLGGAALNYAIPKNLFLRGALQAPALINKSEGESSKNMKALLQGEGCVSSDALKDLANTPSNGTQEQIKQGVVRSATPSFINLISILELAAELNKDVNNLRQDPNSEALTASLSFFYQLGRGPKSGRNINFYKLQNRGGVEHIKPIPKKKEMLCGLFTSDKPSWYTKPKVQNGREPETGFESDSIN